MSDEDRIRSSGSRTAPLSLQKEITAMRNTSFDLRPLGPPTDVGELTVSLRPSALQCVRCGQVFRQHDAQAVDDGIRFVCSGCGLDALEVAAT